MAVKDSRTQPKTKPATAGAGASAPVPAFVFPPRPVGLPGLKLLRAAWQPPLTLDGLSRITRMDVPSLSRLENGQKAATAEIVLLIAAALQVLPETIAPIPEEESPDE